jgi:hypothetical protein
MICIRFGPLRSARVLDRGGFPASIALTDILIHAGQSFHTISYAETSCLSSIEIVPGGMAVALLVEPSRRVTGVLFAGRSREIFFYHEGDTSWAC